jgi:hypothetical protein
MLGANEPDTPFYKKFAAGSAAGALGSLAGNPFDVLKTKLMTSTGKEVPSITATAKELMKNQGIGGFYHGIDSNVVRALHSALTCRVWLPPWSWDCPFRGLEICTSSFGPNGDDLPF